MPWFEIEGNWYYVNPKEWEEWVEISRNRRRREMPIDKPYAYHKPSAEGQTKIDKLREQFSATARLIEEVCVDSRQKSIALTKNEETAMWAIKAVVFNDPKSEVPLTPLPALPRARKQEAETK